MRSGILDRFSGVKPDGSGWSARCPAHDDQRASLSIGEGADGRVLLHCHAGCPVESIMSAVGLETRDLFPEKTGSKSNVSTTYHYYDEGGAHLFDVVRFEPKDFRQRRADGTWSMQGVRRVLYQLPSLQGASVVYVAEGEKDVDRLRHKGLTATTNPGGAGKWREEYTQQLKAAAIAHVVVLADNDDAGRTHAEQVAASCYAAGLTVKVVSLPGIPAKGDVSDWLDAGHSKADLVALVKAVAVYVPTTIAPGKNHPANLPEGSKQSDARGPVVTFLADVQPEPIDWIWPQRLARGRYVLLSGEPGLGKSFLSLDVAARISRGLAFPDGTRAPQGKVLMLVAEDGLSDTVRPRLDSLGGDPSQVAVLEAIRETDGTRAPVSLVEHMPAIEAAIEQVQPVLLIIDPITAFLGRTDSHRDVEVRATLAPLLDLIEQKDCGLLAIGHLSKDSQKAALHRPGGSIAFVAAARLVLALAADPNDPARRLLAPLKSNICRPSSTLAYRITEDRLVWEADAVTDIDVEAIFRPANPGDREERTDAETVIRELLESVSIWPIEAKEALEMGRAHGVAERTLQTAAKRLGVTVKREGFGRGGKWLWHRPATIPAALDAYPSKALSVAPMASMQIPSGNHVNNNIDASKTAFARAREEDQRERL